MLFPTLSFTSGENLMQTQKGQSLLEFALLLVLLAGAVILIGSVIGSTAGLIGNHAVTNIVSALH